MGKGKKAQLFANTLSWKKIQEIQEGKYLNLKNKDFINDVNDRLNGCDSNIDKRKFEKIISEIEGIAITKFSSNLINHIKILIMGYDVSNRIDRLMEKAQDGEFTEKDRMQLIEILKSYRNTDIER